LKCPILVALLSLSVNVRAQLLTTTLLIPSGVAIAGASLEVTFVVFNSGATARGFTIASVVPATLVIGTRSWQVELRADSPSRSTVAPGGFIAQPYCLNLPGAAAGLGVIEVTLPDSSALRSAIEVAGSGPGSSEDFRGNVGRWHSVPFLAFEVRG
jgi:hypothetical protein